MAVTEEWISTANLQPVISPVFTLLNAQQKRWKIVKRKDIHYISIFKLNTFEAFRRSSSALTVSLGTSLSLTTQLKLSVCFSLPEACLTDGTTHQSAQLQPGP